MRVTLTTLQKMGQDGNKIAMLTCYDASFAAVLEEGGVDTLLVGDSLGNVLQGHESTLPVTLRDIVYHTECVARGSKRAFIMGDMPFGTFQVSPQETLRNAADIMAAGAHMVKIEGGRPMAGNGGVSHRPRHTGVRAPGAHAAVGAPAGRLQGAGQGGDRGPASAA